MLLVKARLIVKARSTTVLPVSVAAHAGTSNLPTEGRQPI
jgi:hypothetical protein